MRKSGILNVEICKEIAALGHTQYLVIADPGLPIPQNVPVIDLAVVNGIPAFCDVLDAVAGELVIDSFIFAYNSFNLSFAIFNISLLLRLLHLLPQRRFPYRT